MTAHPAHISFTSPVGPLTVFVEDNHLIVVEAGSVPGGDANDPLLIEARRQIDAYFDGRLTAFDLPVAPDGTTHQHNVWRVMSEIPYGETLSYGEIAHAIGSAARAVGGACGANPIPIVIPCHRVLGAGGAIGGYSFGDGAETKRQILMLEGALPTLI